MSRPSLAHGRPSAIRSAGSRLPAILGGGCALIFVLATIAAIVGYLLTGEIPR